MVREDVNALLFDEPLTVIDPHMKWELRTQLKSLHHEFGHTMIYVTHDQTEALTFADKVVVMYEGGWCRSARPKSCSNARAHLCRLFHRLAGHEPAPRRRSKGETAARVGGGRSIWPSYARRRQGEIGVRPEFVRLPAVTEGLPVRSKPGGGCRTHKIVRADRRPCDQCHRCSRNASPFRPMSRAVSIRQDQCVCR
jgi:glycerol transport system ATP-binding protein